MLFLILIQKQDMIHMRMCNQDRCDGNLANRLRDLLYRDGGVDDDASALRFNGIAVGSDEAAD